MGTTTFSGDNGYTQNVGALAIDLADIGNHDFISVGGVAALNGGSIMVNEIGGFDPAPGSTFDILTAGSLAFNDALVNVTGVTPGGLTYDAEAIGNILRLTVVPEPGSLGLLGAASLALFARRRRSA